MNAVGDDDVIFVLSDSAPNIINIKARHDYCLRVLLNDIVTAAILKSELEEPSVVETSVNSKKQIFSETVNMHW